MRGARPSRLPVVALAVAALTAAVAFVLSGPPATAGHDGSLCYAIWGEDYFLQPTAHTMAECASMAGDQGYEWTPAPTTTTTAAPTTTTIATTTTTVQPTFTEPDRWSMEQCGPPIGTAGAGCTVPLLSRVGDGEGTADPYHRWHFVESEPGGWGPQPYASFSIEGLDGLDHGWTGAICMVAAVPGDEADPRRELRLWSGPNSHLPDGIPYSTTTGGWSFNGWGLLYGFRPSATAPEVTDTDGLTDEDCTQLDPGPPPEDDGHGDGILGPTDPEAEPDEPGGDPGGGYVPPGGGGGTTTTTTGGGGGPTTTAGGGGPTTTLPGGGGPVGPAECEDSADNDGDGDVDYPADLGCSAPGDPAEGATADQCNDALDNDGDGLFDYPEDDGCSSYTDNFELSGDGEEDSGCFTWNPISWFKGLPCFVAWLFVPDDESIGSVHELWAGVEDKAPFSFLSILGFPAAQVGAMRDELEATAGYDCSPITTCPPDPDDCFSVQPPAASEEYRLLCAGHPGNGNEYQPVPAAIALPARAILLALMRLGFIIGLCAYLVKIFGAGG